MNRIDLSSGGGHSFRTALSLAVAFGREVEFVGIRAQRRPAGLTTELASIARAVAAVCGGRVEGDAQHSQALRYFPGKGLPGGEFSIDVQRAGPQTGSVSLLVQTLTPILMCAAAPTTVTISGITHGPGAPTVTYLQTVWLPTIRKFGVRAELALEHWGWAPYGHGSVRLRVEPARSLQAVDFLQKGQMLQVGGVSVASGHESGYAERQRNRAHRRLVEVGRASRIEVQEVRAPSAGSMLYLLVVFEKALAGFTGMGGTGVPAEQVADEAIDQLFEFLASYTVMDKHLADQVLIYAALARGETTFSTSVASPHLHATIDALGQFLPAQIAIDGREGQPIDVKVIGGSRRT
jgi:RNA 3'-terminal phosphate cyclase (ATP)